MYSATDYQYITPLMANAKRNVGLLQHQSSHYLTSHMNTVFNRYKQVIPDLIEDKVFSYIFFTRPDLNIGEMDRKNGFIMHDQALRDPMFNFITHSDTHIAASLTSSYTAEHSFIPILTNYSRSIEIPDDVLTSFEHGETLTGNKIKYGKHNIDSTSAGEISISYIDDKRQSIFKMHKLWLEYIGKVYRGELDPKKEYINNIILDYATSIYYIVTANDGETIIFWGRYTGAFPSNTGANNYSWAAGNMSLNKEVSITYEYSLKAFYEPYLLMEFNELNRYTKSQFLEYEPVYDIKNHRNGAYFVGPPFVTLDRIEGVPIYKLRFSKRRDG